jgi:hypothetical protein
MKRIVFGCSPLGTYDAFGPLTALLWREIAGFEALVILTGKQEDWSSSRHRKIEAAYGDLGITPRYIGFLNFGNQALASKVCRYYASAFNLPADTYLLTGDIDIWPLDRAWFEDVNLDMACHIYFANAHNYEKHATCYIGAKLDVWRDMMNVDPSKSIADHLDREFQESLREDGGWPGWRSDEVFMRPRLWSWNGYPQKCSMIEGDYATMRIDRSKWPKSIDIKGKVDAHLPRPLDDPKVYRAVRPIIEQAAPGCLKWADEYVAGLRG